MASEQPMRPYQSDGVNAVMGYWRGGGKRACLVIPTGGGKTRCAAEVVRRAREAGSKVLAVCHRTELVEQLVARLPDAGVAGSTAPVQVATLQSLLTREVKHDAALVVADECHHLPAGQAWLDTLDAWKDARWLGLTATPERADGKPLGDTFEHLVVGATYSQLLADGHLVDCDVFHPPESISDGVALDPVDAYEQYAEGEQAFIFARDVKGAYDICLRLNQRGITAGVVEADTHPLDRAAELRAFRAGKRRVLVNVYTLTEGVDVPAASVCILARGCSHPSTYLQMVGRVLRPAPGKTRARLVDLCGAVLAHGLPTSDRDYSLDGSSAISVGAKGRSLRVCLACGLTFEAGPTACPRCGLVHTPKGKKARIYSVELQAVYAGSNTDDDSKSRELERLRAVARERGWGVGWVVKQYRQLFGAAPPGYVFDEHEKRHEWKRLQGIGRARGFAPGFAFVRYKQTFGAAPPWRWT